MERVKQGRNPANRLRTSAADEGSDHRAPGSERDQTRSGARPPGDADLVASTTERARYLEEPSLPSPIWLCRGLCTRREREDEPPNIARPRSSAGAAVPTALIGILDVADRDRDREHRVVCRHGEPIAWDHIAPDRERASLYTDLG
jgi:hypothetical protein